MDGVERAIAVEDNLGLGLVLSNDLESNGVSLPFFHLDVDLARVAVEGHDLLGDMQRLENFCAARGIDFGVILIGLRPKGAGDSDAHYYDTTLDWARSIRAGIGQPDHAVFQSWLRTSSGTATVPTNLPESDPQVYSHTRLVNEGLTILQGDDPLLISEVWFTPNAGTDVLALFSQPQAWSAARGKIDVFKLYLQQLISRSPIGAIEQIDGAGIIAGWALDPDAPAQSIQVHFYVEGPAGGPGVFAGNTAADLPRADVNQQTGFAGDHGFVFSVPAEFRDGQPHKIYAYGIDTAPMLSSNTLLDGYPLLFALNP